MALKGYNAARRSRANTDAFRAARLLSSSLIGLSAFWDVPGERPDTPVSVYQAKIKRQMAIYTSASQRAGASWVIQLGSETVHA
jgi:hypothetical protein